MAEPVGIDLLNAICGENLNVYRASPIRLREDVSQEAEISNNYRGRLIYELLQNADDAMSGRASLDDRIVFRLTDTDLWVGNSGRPLDTGDVKGLCGIGASSKGDVDGRRRASIGHKGMGFKSVLEITAGPEVISDDYAFKLSAENARAPVEQLMAELQQAKPARMPITRFPAALTEQPEEWEELQGEGIRTLFRFPLREELTGEQRELLGERLLELPVTTILFLKHLERVEVTVERGGDRRGFSWLVQRERWNDGVWNRCGGLEQSGMYRIAIESEADPPRSFLLAHDADVEIGNNRGGLSTFAWEGVEVTEVSVAALMADAEPEMPPEDWRRFHVFLPTGEACPYPLLVNGAFVSDLSRQEIRVGEERRDYNRFLMHRVAALFRDVLAPHLARMGSSIAEVLSLLDRHVDSPGAPAATRAAQALYEAMRAELADHPFLPRAGQGRLALGECVFPPLVDDDSVGVVFRELLADEAEHEGRTFPESSVCGSSIARIAADHGSQVLSATDAAEVLGAADLTAVQLVEHESGGFYTDPVLSLLEGLWRGLRWDEQYELTLAIRREPLFPVGRRGQIIDRVVTEDVNCFYPPRALRGSVPLQGLAFLMQEACWGALTPTERNQYLREQLVAWQSLFDIREFKFPDVMRASVLPALELDPDDEAKRKLDGLKSYDALAGICQLSGRAPDPMRPLRYERLGTNRALFNLSRLPVPCKSSDGDVEWRPAYLVYLGEDWLAEASVERVLTAARDSGAEVPDVPILVGPAEFSGLLDQFRHLEDVAADDDEDEVSIEEDEEAPPDENERNRWLQFLTWIGVNRVLRPVPFHDVEDRGTGWSKTSNLARPTGWAFLGLPDPLWNEFQGGVSARVAERVQRSNGTPYLYRAHDLEHIVLLLKAATEDKTTLAATALFTHLAHNWRWLEGFVNAEVAIVPAGQVPSMRKLPHAKDEELVSAGEDLWLLRLRSRAWCPSTHGPRSPGSVWLRTSEVERRFGRQGSDAGRLLPLLAVDETLLEGRARGLVQALGIRAELTPSSFTPDDGRLVLTRLAQSYEEPAAKNALSEQMLRQVLRPAYRALFELLTGSEGVSSPAFASGTLTGSPLLVHDGDSHYQFEPSDKVFYADGAGTRERLGKPKDLWTFVLEASRVARGPLTSLLNVRVLEDAISWSPNAGEPPFDDHGVTQFRSGVIDLLPFILARLGAERQDDVLVSQDARRLREFVAVVEPVSELSVGCALEGRPFGTAISRDAFVHSVPRGALTAFVKWGPRPWPHASSEDAEALATALSDLLGVGYFEAFLAMINSNSDDSRLKLLRLAGASDDLTEAHDALTGEGPQPADNEGDPETSTSVEPSLGETPNEEEASSAIAQTARTGTSKTPLYLPQDLLIDGVPVMVIGASVDTRTHAGGGNGSGGGHNGAYGGHTDLDELNQLGMYIALTFERNRLRRRGLSEAAIFDPGDDARYEDAWIFDVSTPGAIAAARACVRFDEALSYLESCGLTPEAPGFDILTLTPNGDHGLDRLIELKSSGVNARVQEMSWNEWKSARHGELRKLFYLYLVGNLRSDLANSVPFIRAVHDPFATIWAQEIDQNVRSRHVQLKVTQFEAAEHLDLGVAAPSGPPEPNE